MKCRSGILVGLLTMMVALAIGFQATPAQACDSCGGHGGYRSYGYDGCYGSYYPRYDEGYNCYYHRPYYFHYTVVHHYHYHHCHDYDYGGCGDGYGYGGGYYRPWWGGYRRRGCDY